VPPTFPLITKKVLKDIGRLHLAVLFAAQHALVVCQGRKPLVRFFFLFFFSSRLGDTSPAPLFAGAAASDFFALEGLLGELPPTPFSQVATATIFLEAAFFLYLDCLGCPQGDVLSSRFSVRTLEIVQLQLFRQISPLLGVDTTHRGVTLSLGMFLPAAERPARVPMV